MHKAAIVVALASLQGALPFTHPDIAPGPESFDMRVVVSGLQNPWDLLWGEDGRIWVTERVGKRITRVNPADGSRSVAVEIPDAFQTHAQNGVLGIAFDRRFSSGSPFLYVSLTYDADPGPDTVARLMVRRYTWNAASGTLTEPRDLLTGLPAGDDHVSGRLVVGHDDHLYLTIGDQGFNQLSLYCSPIRSQELPTAAEVAAQDWRHYEGKVLRIALDGGVPADNPSINGVRSHVFSYGHRNAQGLAVDPAGRIYASEHGPSMDDELNLILPGRNYGWPYVAGYRDDQVYTYNNWSASTPTPCRELRFTEIVAPPSVPQQKETAWNAPDFEPPLRTFFTVGAGYDFAARGNAVIAPSGIDIYAVPGGGIPGWSESVLITSLLRGAVYRVKLAPDGTSTTGPTIEYFKRQSRYRDVLVAPGGQTIFVAADAGSQEYAHSILAFTFRP